MRHDTLRTLRAIDWDFAAPRSGYVGPPHWYPGTFIPALSDALIEAITPPGGIIFDPYGGIGTTGWSAVRSGRSCQIADINPVAILVAYATTSLLALARVDRARAQAALGALARAIGRNDDLFGVSEAMGASHFEDAIQVSCKPTPTELLSKVVAGPPNWEALRPWIAPGTLADLERLVQSVEAAESPYVRLLGLCMVSSMARNISSQHASWGHIADNVRPREMKPQDVHSANARWLRRTKAFLVQPMIGPNAKDPIWSEVHRLDWSRPTGSGSGVADLLLTSPPYADAIDYTLAQRLSLYLLGYDDTAIQSLVAGEIGARRKRFKSISRTEWSDQLCTAMSHQLTWLKPEGAICLVLPHKDSGRSLGEDDLKASLREQGWRVFFEKDRSIHQSFTRQSWTSIKRETIVAFTAA